MLPLFDYHFATIAKVPYFGDVRHQVTRTGLQRLPRRERHGGRLHLKAWRGLEPEALNRRLTPISSGLPRSGFEGLIEARST